VIELDAEPAVVGAVGSTPGADELVGPEEHAR
jgi:hypothetical protein